MPRRDSPLIREVCKVFHLFGHPSRWSPENMRLWLKAGGDPQALVPALEGRADWALAAVELLWSIPGLRPQIKEAIERIAATETGRTLACEMAVRLRTAGITFPDLLACIDSTLDLRDCMVLELVALRALLDCPEHRLSADQPIASLDLPESHGRVLRYLLKEAASRHFGVEPWMAQAWLATGGKRDDLARMFSDCAANHPEYLTRGQINAWSAHTGSRGLLPALAAKLRTITSIREFERILEWLEGYWQNLGGNIQTLAGCYRKLLLRTRSITGAQIARWRNLGAINAEVFEDLDRHLRLFKDDQDITNRLGQLVPIWLELGGARERLLAAFRHATWVHPTASGFKLWSSLGGSAHEFKGRLTTFLSERNHVYYFRHQLNLKDGLALLRLWLTLGGSPGMMVFLMNDTRSGMRLGAARLLLGRAA